MAELGLIFLGGLLGSAHCVGMCGGFALTLGATGHGTSSNLVRQLCYSCGRIFTYSVAGAVAGFGAWQLTLRTSPLVRVQSILAIVAGVVLVIQGLHAAGILPRRAHAGPSTCLMGGLFRSFLTRPGLPNAFIAGVLTGFLPCGMVYGFLALAGSTGNLFSGMVMMTAFGFGTVPLMVLTGCGAGLMNLALRRRVFRLAGWCVLATGAISIVRGLGFLELFWRGTDAGCPFCL